MPDVQHTSPFERLYGELDGVLVLLRRGSGPSRGKMNSAAGDVYREVKVGAVFPATRGPQRSELVSGARLLRAGPISYVARRTTATTFGPLLYELTVQAGLLLAREVAVLGDGARWIWEQAEEHFPGAGQSVDLWHAVHLVWNVARSVFGQGGSGGSLGRGRLYLVGPGPDHHPGGSTSGVAAVPPLSGQNRSVPGVEADDFAHNAERMRYPFFRIRGMQVGSGIAEDACKTLVSTRAKRSGMRWTPWRLDARLSLRTAVLNDA